MDLFSDEYLQDELQNLLKDSPEQPKENSIFDSINNEDDSLQEYQGYSLITFRANNPYTLSGKRNKCLNNIYVSAVVDGKDYDDNAWQTLAEHFSNKAEPLADASPNTPYSFKFNIFPIQPTLAKKFLEGNLGNITTKSEFKEMIDEAIDEAIARAKDMHGEDDQDTRLCM